MTPKRLIVSSAGGLLSLGLPALFVPDLVAGWLGFDAGAQVPMQLLGAALFAFAWLNWIGRGAIYGGIYGRPIVVANFILGMVTCGILVPAVLGGRASVGAWLVVALFGLQAAGFHWLMRRPPWEPSAER